MPTLTTAEAAQRLGITPRAVSLLLRQGKIAGERRNEARGPVWHADETDVDRYAATPKPTGGRPRKKEKAE